MTEDEVEDSFSNMELDMNDLFQRILKKRDSITITNTERRLLMVATDWLNLVVGAIGAMATDERNSEEQNNGT